MKLKGFKQLVPVPVINAFWRLIEIVCYGVVIYFAALCVTRFEWGRVIHWKERGHGPDAEVLGNFGDFMAGAVGTLIALFSMYLLFRNLKAQRQATISNSKLTLSQSFNDLFFRLLDLYREIVGQLHCNTYTLARILSVNINQSIKEYTGKECFALWRYGLMEASTGKTSRALRANARQNYEKLYLEYTNILGSYFRTIYRMLELIDCANIEEEEKKTYAKIIRAQFSEDELFFLYYNSLTEYGKKLGFYLWKYNILKHLRFSSIVEFKSVCKKLNLKEQALINRIYARLRKEIRKLKPSKKAKIKDLPNISSVFFVSFVYFKTRFNKLRKFNVNLYVSPINSLYPQIFNNLCKWSPNRWDRLFCVMADHLEVLYNLGNRHYNIPSSNSKRHANTIDIRVFYHPFSTTP